MTILTDELLKQFDDSILPVSEALTMPPIIYTSDDGGAE